MATYAAFLSLSLCRQLGENIQVPGMMTAVSPQCHTTVACIRTTPLRFLIGIAVLAAQSDPFVVSIGVAATCKADAEGVISEAFFIGCGGGQQAHQRFAPCCINTQHTLQCGAVIACARSQRRSTAIDLPRTSALSRGHLHDHCRMPP